MEKIHFNEDTIKYFKDLKKHTTIEVFYRELRRFLKFDFDCDNCTEVEYELLKQLK